MMRSKEFKFIGLLVIISICVTLYNKIIKGNVSYDMYCDKVIEYANDNLEHYYDKDYNEYSLDRVYKLNNNIILKCTAKIVDDDTLLAYKPIYVIIDDLGEYKMSISRPK